MNFIHFKHKNKRKSLLSQIKFVLLHRKTNGIMDIKARIEQVINEKGLTKKVVAERMGKFNQAFNSLLTNPKWETIVLVATAIGISTQEMLFGIKPEEPNPAEAQQPAQSPVDELPFKDEAPKQEQPLQPVAAFLCPHCGETIMVGLKK